MLSSLARSGLQYLCGIDGDFAVEPFDDEPPERALSDLDAFNALALEHRPDLTLLDQQVEARALQADREWADMWPNIFLTFSFTRNYNPLADNQPSPFAYDPYNSTSLGVVIGADWNFDFRMIGQAEQAEARVEQAEAERTELLGGIYLEIEQAYLEAIGHEARAAAQGDAFDAASAWLRQRTIQFDSGLADFDDLSQPLLAYFRTYANYHQALFDLRLARANLALKVGLEALTEGSGLAPAE
jgi:outer membrane protein TolC